MLNSLLNLVGITILNLVYSKNSSPLAHQHFDKVRAAKIYIRNETSKLKAHLGTINEVS